MARPPRFFVPSDRAPIEGFGARPFVHAVARFITEGPHADAADWAIVVDDRGLAYRARPGRRAALPQPVQIELAQQELLSEPWVLDARELHLFAIEGVEHAPDLPGLNDPLHLRGILIGPFPSDAPSAVHGRLTVTRGDVLEAIVRGTPNVFHGQRAPWHHLLLPGEDAEVIAEGRGLVLGVPLSAAEIEAGLEGNQDRVDEIMTEVLTALRADAERSQQTSPIASLVIPGQARMKKRTILSKLFFESGPSAPAGADFFARLRVARRALDMLAGWPSPRARAVAERYRLDEASWTAAGAHGVWPVALELVLEADALVLTRPKRQKAPVVLAFALDPSFSAWNRGALVVEIEVADDAGAIDLEVDTPEGPARAGFVTLGKTGVWRTLVLEVPKARSAQAGFRLLVDAPAPIRVRRVGVKPAGYTKKRRPVTPEEPLPVRVSDPPPPPVIVSSAARVFLHDPKMPQGWVHDRGHVAERAQARGFEILDMEATERWMRSIDPPGTVCVLAGAMPDALVTPPSPACVLRRYLDRGGRVVWIGDTLEVFASVLEIGPPGPVIKSPTIITDDGSSWGMTVADVATRTQGTKEVTLVLSRAEGKFAASWMKRFDARHPLSGFVRLRGGVFAGADDRLVDDLLRVATHGM